MNLEEEISKLRKMVDHPPVKIYGRLETVSMTPEGELVLYISKRNQEALVRLIKDLKKLENEEIYVFVAIGLWSEED